ncbi:MAG: hypothetical protein QM817_31665 [Archangium sp.]
MLTALALSLVLHGAPLSFTQGEFLGWTADGETYAWTNEFNGKKTFGWREVTTARGDEQDVTGLEEWKKTHALTKSTTLDGVKVTIKADGKAATTFGGAGKAVKLELIAEKGKKKFTGKSMIADYVGKKVRKAKVAAYPDPTGRMVVFVIDFEAGDGEPATSEMVEVKLE